MRRTIATAVVAMATALTVLPAQVAAADETTAPSETTPLISTEAEAEQALDTVTELLTDEPAPRARKATPERAERVELTLAMRDLFVALPRLTGEDRERAEQLLARPTDGAGDRLGDGYTAPSTKRCGDNFCVHYVTSGADAPPNAAWVGFTLKQMNRVWKHQVRKMGFRKPLSDGPVGRSRNGGNGKFDVYLKDVGARGVYGYCVPEYGLRGKKFRGRAISYCVLDNDFARAQFGTRPKPTLAATAAHEFFHAVQFSYDYLEDRWFMESTATWMEERYADNVNDNRQYLPASQVRMPWIPLDTFTTRGSFQYGNWAFWEYLGTRFGHRIVRDVWTAAAPRGNRNAYAIAALKGQLKRRGGFERVYRSFASDNLFPGRTYPEGKAWPQPALAGKVRLTPQRRAARGRVTVNHLAAQHVRVLPDKRMKTRRWALRIRVGGPTRASSPAVVVTVHQRNGKVQRKVVPLNRKGRGATAVPFGRKAVRNVTVTAVNASTRFRCGRRAPTADPQYSCQGAPRDDGKVFALRFAAVKR